MIDIKYRLSSYFMHLLKARSHYPIPSTFADSLVEQIRRPPKEGFMKQVEAYRGELLRSGRTIHKLDLGAGGASGREYDISLKKIAQNSLKTARTYRQYLLVARLLKAKTIFEIGTSLGVGTLYLAKGMPSARIYTIEGCPQTAEVAKNLFKKAEAGNIKLIVGDAAMQIEALPPVGTPKFDLVYIDANHRFDPTLEYFELMDGHRHHDTVFLFDDIHWSREMSFAWQKISRDDRVGLSLDFYEFGLIFFRRKNQQQNIRIRL